MKLWTLNLPLGNNFLADALAQLLPQETEVVDITLCRVKETIVFAHAGPRHLELEEPVESK